MHVFNNLIRLIFPASRGGFLKIVLVKCSLVLGLVQRTVEHSYSSLLLLMRLLEIGDIIVVLRAVNAVDLLAEILKFVLAAAQRRVAVYVLGGFASTCEHSLHWRVVRSGKFFLLLNFQIFFES